MVNLGVDDCFIFVVDTDSYAGNFERELTAFCTGQVGECEVGHEAAELFQKQCPERLEWFEENTISLPDDHGCCRPASIWPTPGYWNDGLGTHWRDADWGSKEAIETYRAEVSKYQREHKDSLPHLDPATALPSRHPAYQSVAMFFDSEPPHKLLEFLSNRALSFKPTRKYTGKFKIEGFRLIKSVRTEKVLWKKSS